MKCKVCGAGLELEQKYCPYCGAKNDLAVQHQKDMEQFTGAFNETRKEVEKSSGKMAGIAVRAVILAVLVIAAFVIGHYANDAWSIRYDIDKQAAVANASAHIEKIEAYLEDGDYIAFASYMEGTRAASTMSSGPFEKYHNLYYIARRYKSAVEWTEHMVFPGKYGSVSNYAGYGVDNILSYYSGAYDSDLYLYQAEDEEVLQSYIEDMTSKLEGILVAYYGLTKEEAESLSELSENKRRVLLYNALEAKYPEVDAEAVSAAESNAAAEQEASAGTRNAEGAESEGLEADF